MRTVKVPVLIKPPDCQATWSGGPPQLNARQKPGYVEIDDAEAKELGLWIGMADRYHTMDQACHKSEHFVGGFVRQLRTQTSGVAEVIQEMMLPGMTVRVVWRECGFVDAMYNIPDKTIELCYEMLDAVGPAHTRFAAAHEVAHAIMWQKNVPMAGMTEAMADELATLFMVASGRGSDVLETARHLGQLGDTQPWNDDHPSPAYRARAMQCLVLGYQGIDWIFDCQYRYYRASSSWSRLIRDGKAS